MRKLIVLTFGLVLSLLLTASPVMAASPSVMINGTSVPFTDESGYPFLDSANRMQVPLRITMEAYGCTVDWNAQAKTAIVEKDGVKVEVPIGQNYILKNGLQLNNDTVAVIKDNRTYLPIRVVLESFGADVNWSTANRTVYANASTREINKTNLPDPQDISANVTTLLNQMKSTFTLVEKEQNGNSEGMTFYYYRYNGELEYHDFIKYWETLDTNDVEQAMTIWASELYNSDNLSKATVCLLAYCRVDGDTGTEINLAGITFNPNDGARDYKRFR